MPKSSFQSISIALVLLVLCSRSLFGQTVNRPHTSIGDLTNSEWTPLPYEGGGHPRTRATMDGYLPTLEDGAVAVEFILKGGDGGRATWQGLVAQKIGQGGEGGTVRFTLPITSENAGDRLQFYIGSRGESDAHDVAASGGGGGATAITPYGQPTNPIAVAAGGGGGAAIEALVSHGYGGGIARNGKNSCNSHGLRVDDAISYGSGGVAHRGLINGVETTFHPFSGGGGSLYSPPESAVLFELEVMGSSPNGGGAGGYHPPTIVYEGDCSGGLFNPNCTKIVVNDINRGGTGWAGGGAGGIFYGHPIGPSPKCSNQYIGKGASGGGGAGYYGGGGGDLERGGGGGQSYGNLSMVQDLVETEGGTTIAPVTGYIQYRVIYDEQPPVAVCSDITVSLDLENPLLADGTVTITAADIDAGSYDDVYVASMSLSQTTFTCDDVGTVPVTLTVLDGKGNGATCTANVTVVDNTPPFMLAMTNFIEMGQSTSVELTPQGPFDISDNCDSYTAVASTRTATCADIGTNILVPIEVTDQYGNTATYNYVYQINKNTPPIVNTKSATIYLGANGRATLTPEDIDDNSIDANGCYTTFTRTLSKTNFTCADAGTHTVTLTVNDGYNSASATATVTVVDPYDRSSGIVYVDENATGSNNGTSWNDAYTDLQDALTLSANCGLTEIWVAQGTYKPGTSEYDSFVIPEGVTLLGGFTGNETSSDQRNWNAAPTLLSGNINGNDMADAGDSHTIVTVTTPNVTLDGLIIAYSYADDPTDNSQVAIGRTGGGLYINQNASFLLKNSILHDNIAFSDGINGVGGAVISFTGDTKLISCLLYDNVASTVGGAVSCESGEVEIINSTLSDNTAATGGGIHLSDGTLLVANSILSNNAGTNGHINLDGGYARLYSSLAYNGTVSGDVMQSRNLAVNPEFEDVAGHDYSVKATSPAINAGNNNFVVSLGAPGAAVDLAGNKRIYDYVNGGIVDMGAYELQDRAPVAICQDIIVALDANGRVIIGPEEIDNGSYDEDNGITLTLDVTEFDCSDLGTNEVILTVTANNGVSVQCTATVTVEDTLAPVPDLANLSDVNAECEVSSLTAPTATDNCSGLLTATHDATLPITAQGTTVITWTYEDAAGNTSNQTQNVVVADTNAPVPDQANLPDIADECEAGSLTAPTATDNCSGLLTATHDATLPITAQGTTVVTWTYEDTAGNTSTQTQHVIIADTEAPVPDQANLPDIADECEVSSLTAPTATDNCSSAVTVSHDAVLPITQQGTTVVTWTYEDASGNTSTQTQNVIVDDADAPVPDQASLPDITSECEVSNLTAPTATDNCSGLLMATHDATLPITTQGNTVVIWTYEDAAGNTSTQTQNVIIDDADAPVPDQANLPDIADECEVSSLTAPTATDNCSSAVTVSHDAVLPITQQGTTVITWTYEDEAGNTSTQTQHVIVEDTMAPELISALDMDLTVYCNEVPEIPNLVFEDNCDMEVQIEYGQNETISGEGYQIERFWIASDAKGNEERVEQNITVLPMQINTDDNIAVCITETYLDLYEKIEGEAGNGIWESQSSSVNINGSVIDPSTMEIGTYTFTYTEQAGMCVNQVVVEVRVEDACGMDEASRMEVSKLLTPNDDGHNDYFIVEGSDTDGNKISLMVFDRWGQQVYKSDDYENDWNGTRGNNQGKLSSGTYFYVIQVLNSNTKPIKGSIYIGTK
ncbi:MAG: gliding motility-associated C-terminal domain-containing protein [Muricauda sp.]|nr:gliding motility-associated C-terminal domain-containing protein [Allomuricauda sp.]MBA4746547.1 gliding motility-associated C-terminal domain-containing protein [Allomuricauda sp.]